MKYLIIIPAHNEEETISYCLQSLLMQTYQEFDIVVVNDGSTDETAEIVSTFVEQNQKISTINLEKSQHQPGSKVVQAFNRGLLTKDINVYDVICKYDADIIFPIEYLQKLTQLFESDTSIGVASGLVYIAEKDFDASQAFNFNSKGWKFENISSQNHVRGPIKAYRKGCLQAIGGLRAILGWDNIDILLAQKQDWKVATMKDVWVKHLRPTAEKYKGHKAQKLGEYFYNIGLDWPLTIISAAKASMKAGGWSDFISILKSFSQQNAERVLTQDEILFIRQLRWKEVKNKIMPSQS